MTFLFDLLIKLIKLKVDKFIIEECNTHLNRTSFDQLRASLAREVTFQFNRELPYDLRERTCITAFQT
jgi:hypothetical protein